MLVKVLVVWYAIYKRELGLYTTYHMEDLCLVHGVKQINGIVCMFYDHKEDVGLLGPNE